MYQTEDLRAGTAFVQCAYDVRVRYDIGGEFAGLNIEDKDKDSDRAEDVVAGLCEVVFNEAILTAQCQLGIRSDSVNCAHTLRSPTGSASDSP